MKSRKRTIKIIARNYKVDPDEVLIILWDHPRGVFDYIKNENSFVKNKDIKAAKGLILNKQRKSRVKEEYGHKSVKKTVKNFDFSSIGKSFNSILYISKNEILKIYEELVTDFENSDDPISPGGLKDEGLLESALFHPQTAIGGRKKYPTIESSGASLMYSLSHNHPFHNGNKRTAIVAMLTFLDRHNRCLICDEDELFKISLYLADHRLVPEEYQYSDAEIFYLAQWIHKNSRAIEKGERPITLRKFKQILTRYNCIIMEGGKIKRTVTKSYFGISTKKVLYSKRSIDSVISEGAEMDLVLIKSIREDLELDHSNNIDSETFYAQAEFSSSEFIIKYKNLLKRLSRV